MTDTDDMQDDERSDDELDSQYAFCLSAVRLAYMAAHPVRVAIDEQRKLAFLAIAIHQEIGPKTRRAYIDGGERLKWAVLNKEGRQLLAPIQSQVIPPAAADLLLEPYRKQKKRASLAISEHRAAGALHAFILEHWGDRESVNYITVTVLPDGRFKMESRKYLPPGVPEWTSPDWITLTIPQEKKERGRRGNDKQGGPQPGRGIRAGGDVDARVAGTDGPADKRSGSRGAGRPPRDGQKDSRRNAAPERTAPPPRPEPRAGPKPPLTAAADKGDNSPSVDTTGGSSIMGATPVYPIADPIADLANPDGYPSSSVRAEIGRRIQARMLAKGWTQSELARQAEIGRDNISSYVRGLTLPGPGMVERIAKALGCSPDDLAPGAGPASRMRGPALEDPPLEIRQVPGQSDVWVRMVRRVSLEQATRILAILNERPESAAAPPPAVPAAPPPPPAPTIPAELTARTPRFAMQYQPKAATPAQPAAAAQAPARPVPTKASPAAAEAVALKQRRIAAAKRAAATRKAKISEPKSAKLPTVRGKSKQGRRR